jgi:hypothetical protein
MVGLDSRIALLPTNNAPLPPPNRDPIAPRPRAYNLKPDIRGRLPVSRRPSYDVV